MGPCENPGSVTGLLRNLKQGDKGVWDGLMPLIYGELKRWRTAILEASGRDIPSNQRRWYTKPTFACWDKINPNIDPERIFMDGMACQIMRQILVDHARARLAGKRGGGEAK